MNKLYTTRCKKEIKTNSTFVHIIKNVIYKRKFDRVLAAHKVFSFPCST